jgi:uncharacterized glyoxalase superfamily protein PhnB
MTKEPGRSGEDGRVVHMLRGVIEMTDSTTRLVSSGTTRVASTARATSTADAPPLPAQTLCPYIAVSNATAAIAFYERALGARVTFPPLLMDDGRVGHCEFEIGTARLMMSDAFPEIGVIAPSRDGVPVTLHLLVPDCTAAVRRFREAGGTVDREPERTPHGLIAVGRDPFGHRWMLNGPVTS